MRNTAVTVDRASSHARSRTGRSGMRSAVRTHTSRQNRSRAIVSANRTQRGLSVVAMAGKEITVEVEKPLGMKLGEKPGSEGGVKVDFVNPGGNAAKAGIKSGDTVLYTSSWFGDELWPADKLPFVMTSINARKGDVVFVVVRGDKPGDYDIKRMNSRPAPKRFGRKLSAAQKALATHICIDCGYIYTLKTPFEEQPSGYVCPQCNAPPKRFARYDAENDKMIGGDSTPLAAIAAVVVGGALIAGLAFLAQ